MNRVRAAALAHLAAGPEAMAQPEACLKAEPGFGVASEKAAPDLARLGYLIGEWTVQNFVRNGAGEFVASPVVSRFRGRYLRDGLSVLAEYSEDRSDGFYGSTLTAGA